MIVQKKYFEQINLLLRILPEFLPENTFGLKGGTAINLFTRNLPRLSVDLDFAYILVDERNKSLQNINESITKILTSITKKMPNLHVGLRKTKEGHIYQAIFQLAESSVKIDINHIIRGTVFPCSVNAICPKIQSQFGVFLEAQTLSFEDLFAGKICAALDRQHPRDFFDIKYLLDNEGFSERLIQAFIVYLISHNRPIGELLRPKFKDIRKTFEIEFEGMSYEPFTYEDILSVRSKLVELIHKNITENHREFLLSFKNLEPKWRLLDLVDIERFPAVKWKILNLNLLNKAKRLEQIRLLEKSFID